MSFNINFNFNTPSDYLYDGTKIGISNGAKFKLENVPSLVKSSDFSSDVGYVYDNTKIEFVTNKFRNKPQIPASAIMSASWAQFPDLNFYTDHFWLWEPPAAGALIVDGKLDLSADGSSIAYYFHREYNPIISIIQTGCVRFKLAPSYTGLPTQDITIFKSENHMTSANTITIYHDVNGDLKLFMSDSAGITIFDGIIGSWTQIQDQEYIFEFNFDLDTGVSRLFIDGVKLGTDIVTVGTRDGFSDYVMFGQGSLPEIIQT